MIGTGNRRFFLPAAAAALFCLAYSCGYTVRSGIAHDIKRISVATFENRTFEHGIEVELASVLAREFIVDGTLSVSDPRTADAVMTGTILEYLLEPYTYGATEADVEQYRLVVRAAVVLQSAPEGRVLWEEEAIEGEATYHVAGSLAKTETVAAREALRDLSRRIVAMTVRPW